MGKRRNRAHDATKLLESIVRTDYRLGLDPGAIASKNGLSLDATKVMLVDCGLMTEEEVYPERFPDTFSTTAMNDLLDGITIDINAEPVVEEKESEVDKKGTRKTKVVLTETQKKVMFAVEMKYGKCKEHLCKAFNISTSTFDRLNAKLDSKTRDKIKGKSTDGVTYEEIIEAIKKEYDKLEKNTPENKEEPKGVKDKSNPSDVDKNKKLTKVKSKNTIIEVGLIANRHDMPVDQYIFQGILSNEEIANFAWQEFSISTWLDDILAEKGYEGKSVTLKVYVTGLQAVLASLMKVVSDRCVGLVLMHYYPDKNIYLPQVVFGSGEEESIPSELYKATEESDEVFLYNTTMEKILDNESNYQVVFNKYTKDSIESIKANNTSSQPFYSASYLVDNLEDAFEIFTKISIEKILPDKSFRGGLFIRDLKFQSNTNSYMGRTLMMTYEKILPSDRPKD